MPFTNETSEDQRYWQDRAAKAEDRNDTIKALPFVIMAFCIALSVILGLALIGQKHQLELYKAEKVTYETHTVTDFNQRALKTVAEARSELKVPGGLEYWGTSDQQQLLASFQGCALGLYEYDEFSPDQCKTVLPENLTLEVDAIRFKPGPVTDPSSGLPTQADLKKRLVQEQKSKKEAAPLDVERTDAPYFTQGKPHVLEETAKYQYVYIVGGAGGDWIVYIFSGHESAA